MPVIHVTMGFLKITMLPQLTYVWLCLCPSGFAMQPPCRQVLESEPAHGLPPLLAQQEASSQA